MSETDDWRSIPANPASGLPEGTVVEVNEDTGDVRVHHPDSPDDDGLSGDREPRSPKVPPFAGSTALEHVPVDRPLD